MVEKESWQVSGDRRDGLSHHLFSKCLNPYEDLVHVSELSLLKRTERSGEGFRNSASQSTSSAFTFTRRRGGRARFRSGCPLVTLVGRS